MKLTLEISDVKVESVIRALDEHTSDREEQFHILQAAIKWIEIAAYFPKTFVHDLPAHTPHHLKLSLDGIPLPARQSD
jgi:hypothetical protein